jgi:hypothetical protein
LEELPEDRLREVSDFARFLASHREREQWAQAARQHEGCPFRVLDRSPATEYSVIRIKAIYPRR